MKVENILTATAGVVGAELVSSSDLNTIATCIVQVVIGIVTVVQLLKKSKNEKKDNA